MHLSGFRKDTAKIEFSQATKRRQILHLCHLIVGKINLLEKESSGEQSHQFSHHLT